LPRAVEIVQERGDPVCERVGLEIVLEWIVAVRGVEAHLDEVRLAAIFSEDVPDLVAEVSLDLEHESSDPPFGIIVTIGEDLFGKGIHAATGLTASDGAKDRDPGVESPLGDRQPPWAL
jgi:hypothetical protein